jgi:hypothetical protein
MVGAYVTDASEKNLLRGHHLTSLETYLRSSRESFMATTAFTVQHYGPAFWMGVNDLYDRIARNPNLKIEVTAGKGDAICSICRKKEACESLEKRNSDMEVIEKFGLVEGETYSAQELIERLTSL